MTTPSHSYIYNNFTFDLEVIGKTSQYLNKEEYCVYTDPFAYEELKALDPECDKYLADYARSYYVEEAHTNAILSYGSQNPSESAWNREIFTQAAQDTRLALAIYGKVRALDFTTQLSEVRYESSSSAGYGYQGHKGEYKGSNHKRALKIAKATVLKVVDEGQVGLEHVILNSTPHIGYTRTQLTHLPTKLKVRGVWGEPFHQIIIEGLTAFPLTQTINSIDGFIHMGKDPLYSVPRLIYSLKDSAKWLYTNDWSQFDSTQSREEINLAFDLVKEMMIFPNSKTEIAFETARHMYIHKKVIGPDGTIYFSHKGTPSGSYFTAIINSIINKFRISYLWRCTIGRPIQHIHVLGDDSIGSDDQYISPEDLYIHGEPLNWLVNIDKYGITQAPEDVEFLGRNVRGGASIREIERCIRLLVYPEHQVTDPQISAYRAEALAEDVGGHSERLIKVATNLKRKYGIKPKADIPHYQRMYHF